MSEKFQDHLVEGLSRLGSNTRLEEFRGLKVGDVKKLTKTEGFGQHWKDRLQDAYEIKEITTVSNGDPTKPEDIHVIVKSTKDGYEVTLGIENFL